MIDGWLSKIEKEMTYIKRETHTSQFIAGDAPYLVPGQSLEKSSILYTLSPAFEPEGLAG